MDATGPLSPEESAELAELLESAAGRSLAFARGVFAALATAPTRVEPTEWMALLLAQEPPDKDTLKRLFVLSLREYRACAECLALRVPAVPSPDDEIGVVQFCKGYTRVAQGDARWTRDDGAFALTVPFAWLAGYVGDDAAAVFAPDGKVTVVDDLRIERRRTLGDDVAKLFEYWAAARREPPPKAEAAEKVGRNDPCPCGSGKKYKKCCGA
jgi:hypothetical protein